MEAAKRLGIFLALACVLLVPLATQSVARGSAGSAIVDPVEAEKSGFAAVTAVVLVALAVVFVAPEEEGE